MGWIHSSEDRGNEASCDMRSMTGNPFKVYVPKQVSVCLSMGDHRFERQISEERIVRQKIHGEWKECVMLDFVPEEVPEPLLQDISRDAFCLKFQAKLGKSWGCTFIPQADGSYAADEIFINNINDIVSRVKREMLKSR